MKVLIADKISRSGVERLEGDGHEVSLLPSVSGDALEAVLRDVLPAALVVRSTRVTAAMMDADPKLELIVRAGAGYDTIDVEAASRRGIFVSNCPGKNADAVAELTIGLILALDRRIVENVLDARTGTWNKAEYAKARGLRGRTLGIVGLGNIGERVVHIGHSLGMSVIAWSRSLDDERARVLGVTKMDSPQDVARAADVVTLHVAATPETRHLANAEFFVAMRDGAFFVNTTRSSVVDEDALRWALDTKGIRAALDVMEGEPSEKAGPFSHPLANHPAVYMTHHIGASTEQAQDAIADEAVRIILAYAETGVVPNCVNVEQQSPATHMLTVRHLDKVGVLAAVLEEVRKAGWNVQEMENLIFAGAEAACARIRFDGSPDFEVIQTIEDHPDILAVSLIAL